MEFLRSVLNYYTNELDLANYSVIIVHMAWLTLFILVIKLIGMKRRRVIPSGQFGYNYLELRRGLEETLNRVQALVVKADTDIPARKKLRILKKARKELNKAYELFPTDIEVKDYYRIIKDKRKRIVNSKRNKIKRKVVKGGLSLTGSALQDHVTKHLEEINEMQEEYPDSRIWKDLYWDVASLQVFDEITSTTFEELTSTINNKAS